MNPNSSCSSSHALPKGYSERRIKTEPGEIERRTCETVMNPNSSCSSSHALPRGYSERRIKTEPGEIERRIKTEPVEPVFDPANMNIKSEPRWEDDEDHVVPAPAPAPDLYDWLRRTTSFEDFMSVIYGQAKEVDDAIIKSVFKLMKGIILISQEMYPIHRFQHEYIYEPAEVWVWTIQIKSDCLPENYTIQFINSHRSLKSVKGTPFRAATLSGYENSAFFLYDRKHLKSISEHCFVLFPEMTHSLTVFADNYHVHPRIDVCDELHIRNARRRLGMSMDEFVGILQNVDIDHLKKLFIEDDLRLEFNEFPQVYNMDYLWFREGHWIKGADLCRMKNKELYIMRAPSLTDHDINQYIKLWQAGENQKLMQACIDFDREPSRDLWHDLKFKQIVCPPYITFKQVWFDGEYDIKKTEIHPRIFVQIQDCFKRTATIFFSVKKLHLMVDGMFNN